MYSTDVSQEYWAVMQSLTITKAENVITSVTGAGNSSETFLNSQTQAAAFTQALNSCWICEGKQ